MRSLKGIRGSIFKVRRYKRTKIETAMGRRLKSRSKRQLQSLALIRRIIEGLTSNVRKNPRP